MQVAKKRVSPALIVAVVALIAALAGTAVAAAGLNGKQKKQVKKISKKIANQQINALAGGLTVAKAANADNATNAGHATSADNVGGVGIAKFSYGASTGSATQTLFSGGGIQLEGSCPAGATTLQARSTGGTTGAFKSEGLDESSTPDENSDDTLSGSPVTLNALSDEENGTFAFQGGSGSVVTGTWATEDGDPIDDCNIVLTVLHT
jgi:hypothetical protein